MVIMICCSNDDTSSVDIVSQSHHITLLDIISTSHSFPSFSILIPSYITLLDIISTSHSFPSFSIFIPSYITLLDIISTSHSFLLTYCRRYKSYHILRYSQYFCIEVVFNCAGFSAGKQSR